MPALPPPPPGRARWLRGPLPATRFVPGHGPHPVRAGLLAPTKPPADEHERHELLVAGIDAFDHHHIWEAHEIWEAAWHAAVDPAEREVLGALIQLAAAVLTQHLGRAEAADALQRRVLERLAGVPGPVWRGVPVAAVVERVQAWRRGGPWPHVGLELAPLRVVAAALVVDGRVFIGRRPPGDRLAGRWELPGGKVEPGEQGPAALARELREELGVDVAVGPWLDEVAYPYPGRLVHLALYAVEGPRPRASTSHDLLGWASEAELHDVQWAPADRPLVPALRAWMTRGAAG